ncbi:MAG: sulfur oxidation c-type cytochrome SoxA [Sulfuricurvum sp.]|uniref:sulfur oxidation c-type cytochrome SoxA n=1 Tax=Sulfuricurvum sp. TaxID=2025608 RepID=UPI002600F208|nr:sulfur oxidation c-type cytochrome SoxA [Sulfuricurvum sp.]MCK9373116.1 sulfur oxidation c-type cytochrome SoxA [Sulfuricurvum sp.]
MRTLSICAALLSVALCGALNAEEKLSMSDADKKMYAELVDNNPAEMDVAEGEQLFSAAIGTEAYAKMVGVKEKDLPAYIAGFPRYVEAAKRVVTLSQTIQMAMADRSQAVPKLESKEMLKMTTYLKSLANEQKTNIDVKANKAMKEMMALGQDVFEQRRGGRGLSCNSCHSADIVGQRLRMQPLPDLGASVTAAAGTWPAYRMTKSETTLLDKRFQQCMDNALLAKIPLGSKEMVALEVYITNKTKGNAIQVPGVKR